MLQTLLTDTCTMKGRSWTSCEMDSNVWRPKNTAGVRSTECQSLKSICLFMWIFEWIHVDYMILHTFLQKLSTLHCLEKSQEHLIINRD